MCTVGVSKSLTHSGAGVALVVDDREVFWRLEGSWDGGEPPRGSVRRAAAAGRCSWGRHGRWTLARRRPR